jgi:pantothenate kinase-related protein Tda10
VKILWLFGPPGVGKSVTSWELLNLLSDRNEPTAYLDIDQLGWPLRNLATRARRTGTRRGPLPQSAECTHSAVR